MMITADELVEKIRTLVDSETRGIDELDAMIIATDAISTVNEVLEMRLCELERDADER